jgi:flagellar hook-length control protein FliK
MTISLATLATTAARNHAGAPKDAAPAPASANDAAATAGDVVTPDTSAPRPATDARVDFQALLLRGASDAEAGAERADAANEHAKAAPAEDDAPRAEAGDTTDAGDQATTASALAQAALTMPALAMPVTVPGVMAWRVAGNDDAATPRAAAAARGAATLPVPMGDDAGAPKAPVAHAGTHLPMDADASTSSADATAPAQPAQPRAHAAGLDGAMAAVAPADGDTPAATPAPATASPAVPLAQAFAAAMPGTQPAAAQLLALHGNEPAQWRPTLREALGERLQVQVGDHSERAVIRLDPPALGRIEIVIRHEAGNLQVHLSASNGDVLRQLHAIGDSLRQDLVHRQYGEVAVVVSDGRGEGGGQRREGEAGADAETPGRGLGDAEAGADTGAFAFLQDRE